MGPGAWKYLVLAGMCLVPAAMPAAAGDPVEGRSAGDAAGAPSHEAGAISLHVGRSRVIHAPWPTARVSVTDPKIADVKVLTPRQMLLQAKSIGSTDLILWSRDEKFWHARVDVSADIAAIKARLGRLFPGSTVQLTEAGKTTVVTGRMRTAEQAVQLHRFMEASGLSWVDMTSVAGVQQVLLKVRVAEAQRVALRALGINALHTGKEVFGGSTIGSASGGVINPIQIGPAAGTVAGRGAAFVFTGDVGVSPSVTLFAGFPGVELEFFLQAIAENQYLRVLAEPTLVALSGEQASFLAGGEYPIPVVQGTGGAGGTTVTVEYRTFGIQLNFKPTVLGDGRIRLYVAPEVSELSDVGAVEIQGFSIPSVLTRKAETTLVLRSGQTFAMAGLIHRRTSARTSRVPGLGSLPVLGALFRSVRYESGETELVVLVTASLVEPLSSSRTAPLPGALHRPPNDWELYARGRIQGRAPARLSPADADWLKELGLDRLEGPGAWATYLQPAPQSQARPAPRPARLPKKSPSDQPRPGTK